MKTNRRVLLALMLAVTSGLAACDQPDGLGDLTGPEVQAQFSNHGRSGDNGRNAVKVVTRTNALSGDVTYSTTYPVGPQGATLNFGGHKLVVPKQSVRHWTHFTATLRAGEEIRLDMRAYDMFGEVTTFKKAVQLTIDLSDANIENLNTVAVYYLNPNGAVERMPSSVNHTAKSVTGLLDHFSDYIPGTLRNESPLPELP